ncbi:hypothetical protein ACS0PU_009747 [Formica fusca]
MAQFNNGNMPYELLIKSNTIVSNLGIFEPISSLDSIPEPVELCEVLNTTKRIILKGYVKTNFLTTNNKLNKIIGYGSITDGIYKLEVHIMDFTDDDYFVYDIKKGDHIEVTGIMQTEGNKSL